MRNGTQQEWINADSVAALEIGEIGFESDTYRMKIGNTENDTIGTLYKDLEYFAAGIVTVQGVDATHENGLMIDSDGKLELDIGNLVGRVDYHDTIFAEHTDSIEVLFDSLDTINIEIERIESDHQDSIEKLVDSIQQYADSITLNLEVSVGANADNIEDIFDSIADLDEILDTKVDKSGDTMTGPLVFDGIGVIGTTSVPNLILQSGSTYINNLLEPRQGVRIGGTIIETNDSYLAVSEEDIVDVKSLKDINPDINKILMRTKIADGGKLFRNDINPERIIYRPSVPLKEKSEVAHDALEDVKNNLNPNTDPSLIAVIDILQDFFYYIMEADSVDSAIYESPVEFDTEE